MKLLAMKLFSVLFVLAILPGFAAESPRRLFSETETARATRMAWWVHARFGMFIHFGLYSLPARHEWVKSIEQMDNAAYEKYFDLFDPYRLDVREWVRQAKRAGMKYMVLTTKHHEGFCLFDSKQTDYKITKTKYGKDLVREFVDACRAEDMRIGFYYSLPDWHHEAFPIDHYHPQRPVAWGPWDGRSQDVPQGEWDKVNVGRDMADCGGVCPPFAPKRPDVRGESTVPEAPRLVALTRVIRARCRYDLAPTLSKRLIKRTDPERPQTPQQKYNPA